VRKVYLGKKYIRAKTKKQNKKIKFQKSNLNSQSLGVVDLKKQTTVFTTHSSQLVAQSS
jgi:hypothetical protein